MIKQQKGKSILKYVAGFFGFILIVMVLKGCLAPSKPADAAQRAKSKTPLQAAADKASTDTTNETLEALSAQVQEVTDQNKKIIARDNAQEQTDKQSYATMQQQIHNELQQVNQQQNTVTTKPGSSSNALSSQYPLGNGTDNTLSVAHPHLTWVDDMQDRLGGTLPAKSSSFSHNLSATTTTVPAWNTTGLPPASAQQNAQPIPRYTVPENSVLANTATLTSLIGRIPINGVVHDPYTFLLIVGGNNLAANNTYMPDVATVMVGGTATGDMALSCVRGTITSLTFIFQDGTISTINAHGDNGHGALGYLATQNGNPCISGHFYTNAPEFLTGNVLLGGAQGAAAAFAATQTTSTSNIYGGETSTVTGSPYKYAGGQAGVGAASEGQQWWNERERNSFDAVYVPPGKNVAIIVTKQIPIDYNPQGRKVTYDHSKSNPVTRAID